MSDGRGFRRVAALHRELAEAYERLAGEPAARERRRVAPEPTGPAPSPVVVERVKRRLRRQGLQA